MIWKLLFPAIYIYTIFDGLIVNMTFPAKLPLLLRDIMVLIVYFFFVINEHLWLWLRELRQRVGIGVWLCASAFIAIAILQIFNPLSPGLAIGLVGFRVLFFYWPLALLAYVYMDRPEKVIFFMKIIFYVSVPVNCFGLYQFYKGPELLSSLGVGFERTLIMAHIEGVGALESFVRVIGTFASTGQYSNFLAVNAMFGLALFFSNLSRKEFMIFIAIHILNMAVMLASGTRATVIVLLLSLMCFFYLCRRARPILLAVFIVGIGFYFGFSWLGSKVMQRYQSLGQIDMVKSRTVTTSFKMFGEFLEKNPMGEGLGSASSAVRHLPGLEAATYELVENYPSKLQKEVGLPGVILYYVMIYLLMTRWLNIWRYSFDQDSQDYYIFAALSAYCFVLLGLSSLLFVIDTLPIPIFAMTIIGTAARMTTYQSERRAAAVTDER